MPKATVASRTNALVRRQRPSKPKTPVKPEDWQVVEAGFAQPLPIVYGRCKVGATVGIVRLSSTFYPDRLHILALFCAGEIDRFDEITCRGGRVIWKNGELVNYSAASYFDYIAYLGTDNQVVDFPAIEEFADNDEYLNYQGICCVSFQVYNGYEGIPDMTAIIRGRKIYDPREPLQDPDDKATWAWSDNPALCLADFISNEDFGCGWNIDWDSVSEAAFVCDQTMPDGQPYRTMNYVLGSVKSLDDWLEELRHYAGCFVVRNQTSCKLVPWRSLNAMNSQGLPWITPVSLTADDIVRGSLKVIRRGGRDIPTVMRVEWTEEYFLEKEYYWWDFKPPSEFISNTAYAYIDGVLEGTVPVRESSLSLPGITTYSEACRAAYERLTWAYHCDITVTATLFDEGLQFEPGDIVKLTHPVGFNDDYFWVTEISLKEIGRWNIVLEKYHEAPFQIVTGVYTPPESPEPFAPNYPPTPGTLTVTEERYQYQKNWQSRLKVTWDDVEWPFTHGYQFVFKLNNLVIQEQFIRHIKDRDPVVYTIPVSTDVTYDIWVYTISATNVLSDPSKTSYTAAGANLPPPNVTNFSAWSVKSTVYLSWTAVEDIEGISGYQIRRGSTASTWENAATIITKIDATKVELYSQPDGTFKFYIKAIDNSGLFSPSATFMTLTVEPGSARSDDDNLAEPATLTLMVDESLYGVKRVAVTDYGATLTDVFGVATWEDATYSIFAQNNPNAETGTVLIETVEWDRGLSFTGQWSFIPQYERYNVTETSVLRLKQEGGTYQDFEALVWYLTARYMKTKVTHTAAAGVALAIELPVLQKTFQVDPGSSAAPSTNYENDNPILKPGELAYETDTNLVKLGDGVNNYVDLPHLQTGQVSIVTIPTIDNTGKALEVIGLYVAGENLNAGQVIYLKDDGKWWLASAASADTSGLVALAMSNYLTSATVTAILRGTWRYDDWNLSVGQPIYLSNIPGMIATSPGTYNKLLGYSLSYNYVGSAVSSNLLYNGDRLLYGGDNLIYEENDQGGDNIYFDPS